MLKTTAGWDDAKGVTVVQRHKEEAADYRYFPEPDLVPVVVSDAQIAAVRAAMGELPQAQRKRLDNRVRPDSLRRAGADREGPGDGRVLRGGGEGARPTARPHPTA